MMTRQELFEALETIGLPVAYRQFEPPAPPPPYIAFFATSDSDLRADNTNYAKIRDWQVELYSDNKDVSAIYETKIEDLFDSLSIPYSKMEAFIESEKLLQVTYEIQLIGG